MQSIEYIARNPGLACIAFIEKEIDYSDDLQKAGTALILEDPVNMSRLITYVTSTFPDTV